MPRRGCSDAERPCRPPPILRRPMPTSSSTTSAGACRPPPIPRRPMPRLQPRRPDRPVVRPQFRGDQCPLLFFLQAPSLSSAPNSEATNAALGVPPIDWVPVVRPQFRVDQCPCSGPRGSRASCRPPPIPRRPMPRACRASWRSSCRPPSIPRRPMPKIGMWSRQVGLSSAPNSEATNARGNTNPLPRHDNIAFRPLEFTERMRRARGFRRAHRRPRSGWESHRPDSGAAPRALGSATTARPGPACPAKGISGRRSTA